MTEGTKTPKRTPRGAAAAPLPRLTMREIVDANDLPEKVVDVPEWGGSVLLRGLTTGAITELQETKGQSGGVSFSLGLVAATMADPVFTPEQAELLREKSSAVMERLLREAMIINGLGEALERALVEQFPD